MTLCRKICSSIALYYCCFFTLNADHIHEIEQTGLTSMFSLPQSEIDVHFRSVKEQVNLRWNTLALDYEFPLFSFSRTDDSIADEFFKLRNQRIQLWFVNPSEFPCQSNPLFKISQILVQEGRFRQPNCISFEHSNTDPSYNSSSIAIGKRRFFALEGPQQQHVRNFFRLMTNWNVAYLVCLTNATDNSGSPKCHPYWDNRMVQIENSQYLSLPVEGAYEKQMDEWKPKKLPYLFWPSWEDNHGVDPELLVKAANQVRQSVNEENIIAVHCSAGVGRTGTFIAIICLLDQIDEQLSRGISPDKIQLSIAQLVLYLNFYRPFLVAKAAQYTTLYRAIEYYLRA